MSDEDENQEVPEEGAGEPEPERQEPDPRDAEMERLRSDNQRMMETLTRFVGQQPQQSQPQQHLRDVDPDFSDAEEYGLTPAQMRAIYSKVSAGIAPKIERVARMAEAPRPKSAKENLEEIIREAGVSPENRRLAKGAIFEKAEELQERGIDPMSATGRRALIDEVRTLSVPARANGAANPSRATGVGGGSLPPGQKPKVAEKKYPTLCETIKADQKKRGLYRY